MRVPLHCFNAEFMHMLTGPSQKNRDVKATHYMQNTLKSENIILPSGGHWITVDENGVILTCPLCRLLCKCIEASCCCFPSHRSQLRHQIHLTTYWNANQTRNLLYLLSCCCKGSSQEKNCVLHANIRKCEFYGYSTLTIFHQ